MAPQRTRSLSLFEEQSGQWPAFPLDQAPTPTLRDEQRPLVSIVTPSYNQGQYIRETIESVLSQDYPNIEYWVIDGGSTDDTVPILQEYEGDPRFNWLSEPDRGQADAINKGWARCQGDILCWLNSDDYFATKCAVSVQAGLLASSPSNGLVYGDCIYIDPEGKKLAMYPARAFSAMYLLRACFLPQPSVFLRREIVAAIGPLDTTFAFAMDYDYWLRCSTVTTPLYNKQVIATYRLHSTSKTVNGALRFGFDMFEARIKHLSGSSAKQFSRRQKRSALADAIIGLAIIAVKADNPTFGFRLVKEAAQLSLTEYRYLHFLLTLFDHVTGTSMESTMSQVFYFLQNPGAKLRSRLLDRNL